MTMFTHNVTITPTHIFIGCKMYTPEALGEMHDELPAHEVDALKYLIGGSLEYMYLMDELNA